MFTDSDYDKLKQLMAEKPENEALIQKLLYSHKETISTISHEIRNPLTLVYSTMQLIESLHPEVASFKYWDSMREDMEYMKQLLEELSAFNNGSVISISQFNFRTFMEQLVLSFAAANTDSGIEFTSCISKDLPDIRADRIKLKEVFLNLLRNASEATPEHGTIRLDAACGQGNIIVSIQDSGCGIDKEYLDDLFTPFVTHKQGGTGLGLAIVKRTVEAHHGTVQVQSELHRGSRFTVTLPIQ